MNFKLFIFIGLLINASQVFSQKKELCNILSLSGGGSHASIALSILDEIKLPEYDLIAGMSAGTINAMFLGYFNNKGMFETGLNTLTELWKTLKTSEVYSANIVNINKIWAYYDNTPLYNSLLDIFSQVDGYHLDKPVVVGLTNLNKGILDLKLLNNYNLLQQINWVMAASSMPFLFPPKKINNTLYSDGTILADEIIHGLYNFIDCNNYNITVISSDNKLEKVTKFDNPKQYVSRLLSIILDDYNNQLVEVISTQCFRDDYTITLNYCYPLSKDINKFIKIKFENADELMAISKSFKCEKYNFCT